MADMPDIADVRSGFWREIFAKAQDYETYLGQSDAAHAEKWGNALAATPDLDAGQVDRVTAVDREINVLMYSGVWCGDCVRQGPMLKKIADACGDNVTLKIIDRDLDAKLSDELRILGGRRVPVVVFLSEDFFEIARLGDKLLSVYQDRAATLTGAACSTGLVAPPQDALKAEMADWVDAYERALIMARLSGFLRKRHND